MPAATPLTLEKARWLKLHKQSLLRRAEKGRLMEVVQRMAGVQAQLATAPAIALWARVAGFTEVDFDKALYESRALVKTWCMRGTLHIIPSDELALYREGTKESWLRWWRSHLQEQGKHAVLRRRAEVEAVIRGILEQGPATRSELSQRLAAAKPDLPTDDLPAYASFKALCYSGTAVVGRPKGQELTVEEVSRWLLGLKSRAPSVSDARRHLIGRFLAGYGPAALQDFAHWIGLPLGELRDVWDDAVSELVEVKIQEMSGAYWMLPDDLRALDRFSQHVPLRLLPNFDVLLLAHQQKTWFVNSRDIRRVYLAAGNIAATILADGTVKGRWQYQKTSSKLFVTATLFERLEPTVLDQLHREVEAFAHSKDVPRSDLRVKYA